MKMGKQFCLTCEIVELEKKAKAVWRSLHKEKRGRKGGSGDFSAMFHMVTNLTLGLLFTEKQQNIGIQLKSLETMFIEQR